MKLFYILFSIIMAIPLTLSAVTPVNFGDYFIDKTMRIDYYHIGDAKSELITLHQIYKYGIWAGSKKNLIDNFNNGRYYVKIYDAASGNLIYSKGFDSYFGEYQTSDDALKGIKRTYSESALIPYPKYKIKFVLEKRNLKNKLEEFYSTEIDPSSIVIIKDKITDNSVKIFYGLKSGDPHTKVDIAILGEGYTLKEEKKFEKDFKRFTKIFLNQEPYKLYKNNFNIYGVFKPSEESGVDEPTHGVYKNTAISCTFNSLGSERYMLTEDNKALRSIASHVPYDAIYIMVNTKRYGGGGIYNLYCTFSTDNQWSEYIFLHEFGHSFTGLADEYYSSDVAYNDFYPKGVEPVEPNITALLDPNNIKWKKLVTPGIEIPTPWKKEAYDKKDYSWQKSRRELNNKIAEAVRNSAPTVEIKKLEDEYNKEDKEHTAAMDKYLRSSKYWGKVGAFEGAGYSSKGLYRPMIDCIMFSKGKKPFCKVCEAAIIRMIKYYSE
jgi:hypothetical protein